MEQATVNNPEGSRGTSCFLFSVVYQMVCIVAPALACPIQNITDTYSMGNTTTRAMGCLMLCVIPRDILWRRVHHGLYHGVCHGPRHGVVRGSFCWVPHKVIRGTPWSS